MRAGQLHRAITLASREGIGKGRQPKMALKLPLAALAGAVMLAAAAHAEPAPENSGQNPVVRPVFNQSTNVPGKSLEAVTVSYPPGAKSGGHHHAKSAFIMAYVISGAIRSQVEGEPARVYHAGETWMEAPRGAPHGERKCQCHRTRRVARGLFDRYRRRPAHHRRQHRIASTRWRCVRIAWCPTI